MTRFLALLTGADYELAHDNGQPMRPALPAPPQPKPPTFMASEPHPPAADAALPMLPRTLAQAETFIDQLDGHADVLASKIDALQEQLRQNRAVRHAFDLAAVAMLAAVREPEQQSAD